MKSICLKEHTSMKMGGRADLFEINEIEDLERFRELTSSRNFFILSKGCNLLVSDSDLKELCVKMNLKGIEFEESDTHIRVTAAAGEDFDDFTDLMSKRALTGIELLAGIPGLVGASPIQNIGAYGKEVSDFIESVFCYDIQSEEIIILKSPDCRFEYRSSIFNNELKGRYIILAVSFVFEKIDSLVLEHKDIISELNTNVASSGVELRDAIVAIRGRKGMMLGEKYPDSAGSFFKNPIIDKDHFEKIKKSFQDIPSYPDGDRIKVPAAWLIGQSGYEKGFVHKGVGISPFHNLSLINVKNGSFSELMELADMIKDAVREKFEIDLKIEPEIIP